MLVDFRFNKVYIKQKLPLPKVAGVFKYGYFSIKYADLILNHLAIIICGKIGTTALLFHNKKTKNVLHQWFKKITNAISKI